MADPVAANGMRAAAKAGYEAGECGGAGLGLVARLMARDSPKAAAARDSLGLTSGWYARESKAYAKGLTKSGRAQWFEDAFKPVKTTACETLPEGGTVCGFVYFPCTDENGCRAVMQGTWE